MQILVLRNIYSFVLRICVWNMRKRSPAITEEAKRKMKLHWKGELKHARHTEIDIVPYLMLIIVRGNNWKVASSLCCCCHFDQNKQNTSFSVITLPLQHTLQAVRILCEFKQPSDRIPFSLLKHSASLVWFYPRDKRWHQFWDLGLYVVFVSSFKPRSFEQMYLFPVSAACRLLTHP